jgi:apolipoprotein N-acyltransferase
MARYSTTLQGQIKSSEGGLRIAGALLSGSLVVLAFPLLGRGAGLDHLVWFALVPLFAVAVGAGARAGLVLGWTAGIVIEAGGFLWILLAIKRFTSMPWPLASACFLAWLLYSSLTWALLGCALGACRKPRGVLGVLPLWVGIEHLFPRLFPWHLGGALYGREKLLQCADLVGASGLTALVFLSSATVYLAISAMRGKCRFPLAASIALAALVPGALAYGSRRLEEVREAERAAPELRVITVQGARHPLSGGEEELRWYLQASRKALEEAPADLVVWPEGVDPCPFDLSAGRDPWGVHREARGACLELRASPLAAALVTGGSGFDVRRVPQDSNLAAYVAPGQRLGIYEKNIRFPFGEVVPLLDLLPRSTMETLGLRVRTIARGEGNPVFRLGERSFRNLICYEAIFPGYYTDSSSEADFLVNVTEDMWYGWTAQIPQQASVLVLRVVETRAPLVRATNVGPSGVIDASGAFHSGGRIFAPEVIRGSVRPVRIDTLYEAGGRFAPVLCLLGSLSAWAILAVRRRRRDRIEERPGKMGPGVAS